MKALKEKRLSLRSLARRGLVILSLFALAFAFASCDDTGGSDPVVDPTGSTNPSEPEPAGPVPASIRITSQPTSASFQGCAPDLTGVAIQVLWTGDTAYKTYTGKDELEAAGFYPFPPYCDVAGMGYADSATGASIIGKFYMSYAKGGQISSNELQVPGVIPLQKVTSIGSQKVYSDTEPIYSGVTLTGVYEYDTTSATTMYGSTTPTAIPTGKIGKTEKNIPLTYAYPPIDYSNYTSIQSSGIAWGYIGKGTPNGATAKPAGTVAGGTFSIKVDYYQVAGIEFTGFDPAYYLYDDDVVASKSNDPAKYMTTLKAAAKNAQFKVSYANAKGETDTKNISGEQFQKNVAYAAKVLGISWTTAQVDSKIFYETNGLRTDPEDPDTPILAYSDDTGNWTFFMEYVPQEFIVPGSPFAYLSRVPVDVPVATYTGVQVTRNAAYPYNIQTPFVKQPTTMSANLLTAINQNWKLQATYALGNAAATPKTIAFTSGMFYAGNSLAGYDGALNIFLGDPGRGELSSRVYVNGGDLSGMKSFTEWDRGYELPLAYRRQLADPNVVIDVEFISKDILGY